MINLINLVRISFNTILRTILYITHPQKLTCKVRIVVTYIYDKLVLSLVDVYPHLTSRFCEDELCLNSLSNMVLESILARFVKSIVSTNIELLSDYSEISSLTHKMCMT